MGGEQTRQFLKVDGKVTEMTLGTKVEMMEGVLKEKGLNQCLSCMDE